MSDETMGDVCWCGYTRAQHMYGKECPKIIGVFEKKPEAALSREEGVMGNAQQVACGIEAGPLFSLEKKPEGLVAYRKRTTVALAFIAEPFTVVTQEGPMLIAPETVDGWDGGYYVAYPDDGSKPYSIAPSFVRDNYVPA